MAYQYTIPAIPKSLNHYAGRQNSWEYRQDKEEWEWRVRAACRYPAAVPPAPLAKAKVRIVYYFPTKIRHDPDNYSGKFINDGLVRAGIIKDDSFDCVELTTVGRYDKGNPRTEIYIEEIKND